MHDLLCERGQGMHVEECHCVSRAYQRDTRPVRVDPVEVPWGLFAFERGAPDTRGHRP